MRLSDEIEGEVMGDYTFFNICNKGKSVSIYKDDDMYKKRIDAVQFVDLQRENAELQERIRKFEKYVSLSRALSNGPALSAIGIIQSMEDENAEMKGQLDSVKKLIDGFREGWVTYSEVKAELNKILHEAQTSVAQSGEDK